MTYSQADKGTVDTEGPGHWGPTILYNMCWISSFYKAVWKHIRGLCTSRAPPRKFRTCLCNLKLHGFTKEKLSWQRLVTYPNCHFLSFLLQNKPWVSIVQQCASSPSGINCSAMRYNAKLCKALESLLIRDIVGPSTLLPSWWPECRDDTWSSSSHSGLQGNT